MSRDAPEVTAARIEAERARGRLIETLRELQERLSPAHLAQNAWSDAKTKGAELAEGAVGAVKKRPGVAGGVVAALALFLAREPLIEMAGKLAGRDKPKSGRKAKKKEPTTETSD